ncbi:hypothetical protein [Cupriavidus sp. RAF12]|uniref:hypothetical protein n=1 Tax=Cupriavidus sp. RAF12 TaxID=3233050 RepID=UPI003F908F0B
MSSRTQRLFATTLIAASALGAQLAHAAGPRTSPEVGDRYGYNFNVNSARDVYTDGARLGQHDVFLDGAHDKTRDASQPASLRIAGRDLNGVSATPGDDGASRV